MAAWLADRKQKRSVLELNKSSREPYCEGRPLPQLLHKVSILLLTSYSSASHGQFDWSTSFDLAVQAHNDADDTVHQQLGRVMQSCVHQTYARVV